MPAEGEKGDKSSSSSKSSKPRPPKKFADGKFELVKKLGAGCFGEVYLGTNTATSEQVAVKTEESSCSAPQLEQEAETLNILRQPVQQQGFVECFYYGQEGGFNMMVMELLGASIEDMVQKCGGKFKKKTCILLAQQLLARIEYLHAKGMIHRDIKPENFMFGVKSKVHHVYLIDFGLSKRYWDKKHASMRQKLSLTGTARYASINAHKGLEQSRRDDLEAIGHMLMYFLRGALPWSGLDAKTKQEKYKKIMEKKEEFPLQELCDGYPDEFRDYLAYARNLAFTQRPDYNEYQDKFKVARDRESIKDDHEFEWFDTKPPSGPLTAMVPREKFLQPDDPDEPKGKPGGAKRRGFCFCGGGATKED